MLKLFTGALIALLAMLASYCIAPIGAEFESKNFDTITCKRLVIAHADYGIGIVMGIRKEGGYLTLTGNSERAITMEVETSGGAFSIHDPKGEITVAIINSPTNSSSGIVYTMNRDNLTCMLGK